MTRLEKVANVAIIVACIAIVGSKAYEHIATSKNTSNPSPMPDFARKHLGKKLTALSSGDAPSRPAVVLLVSKNCHFCSESMPFYKRLADLRERSRQFDLIAAVSAQRETIQDGEAYFRQHGVTVDKVAGMNFSELLVPGTPTLLVLDREGAVRGMWSGRLNADKEKDVLLRLKAFCAQCSLD